MDFSALDGHEDMLSPGNPEVARLRADAIPLLTQLDERENLRTVKVVPLPAGMWNALYRLEPAGVVVKLSAGDNGFEVGFLRQAAALGVPVPEVYGAGGLEHPTLPDVTYFLMSYIASVANAWPLAHAENGMTRDSLRQLGRDLGQALATLHTVHLGHVNRFGERVETWKEVLTDGFSPNWDEIAPNALFAGDLLRIFEHILAATDYWSFRDGRLIHCDLNLSNVLVDTNTHRLKAIIDPGGDAGMPMFDLGYAAVPWDHGFEFHQALLDGYRQRSDQFDPQLFYASILVTAYRHERFHNATVRESIFRDILPHIDL